MDTGKLKELITQCREQGVISALRETRHYTCHRDKREYWNEGRLAIAGHYPVCRALMLEFGEVLLGAIGRFHWNTRTFAVAG